MKILVDTNVIIDILCKREPFFGVTNFNWGHYFWGLIWGQF